MSFQYQKNMCSCTQNVKQYSLSTEQTEQKFPNRTILPLNNINILKINNLIYKSSKFRSLKDSPLPTSYNLLDKNDSKKTKITTGANQSTCGCCFAFAISSALSDRYALTYNIQNPSLSSAYTISSYFNDKDINICDIGASVFDVCKFVETNGIKHEKCWPYSVLKCGPDTSTLTVPNNLASLEGCACTSNDPQENSKFYINKNSTKYLLGTKDGVLSKDPLDTEIVIMNDILTNGTVITSVYIYDDFELHWNTSDGVYIRNPDVSNKYVGGHAMCIIGWGQETTVNNKCIKYWIVRNSWGINSYHPQGLCKIAKSSSIDRSSWIGIDIPIYMSDILITGGCVSIQPAGLPTKDNNYGLQYIPKNSDINNIGFVDYPPILPPIYIDDRWELFPGMISILRYIFFALLTIFFIVYYYYMVYYIGDYKHINTLRILYTLLGTIFAIIYIKLAVDYKNLYGLFYYVNDIIHANDKLNVDTCK